MFIRRRHLLLIALGAGSELLYALYFLRQFPLLASYQRLTDIGGLTHISHLAFAAFVIAVTLLFVLFGFGWRQVRNLTDRTTLWLVFGFSSLFAVTMALVYPFTSTDVFSYVDQSLIMVHYHANPMFTPPSNYPNDPLMLLSGIWRTSGSPYGPLGLVIDALPTFVTQGNLLANLILLKLMFSAIAILSAFVVYRILLRVAPSHALTGAFLVAWNPFVLIEFCANAHNDIAMMLFVLLAILSLAENELLFGVVLLVASALVKYATGILIPLFIVYAALQQMRTHAHARWHVLSYLLLTGTACLALLAAAFAPFWEGPNTLHPLLGQTWTYFTSFGSTVVYLSPHGITQDQATLLGRLLYVPVYCYALWLAAHRLPNLVAACMVATFGVLALALANIWYWYAIWPLVLAMVVPRSNYRLAMLLLAYGAELSAAFYYFIWGWLGGQPPGFQLVSEISYTVCFVPPALVIAGVAAWDHAPTLHRWAPQPPWMKVPEHGDSR